MNIDFVDSNGNVAYLDKDIKEKVLVMCENVYNVRKTSHKVNYRRKILVLTAFMLSIVICSFTMLSIFINHKNKVSQYVSYDSDIVLNNEWVEADSITSEDEVYTSNYMKPDKLSQNIFEVVLEECNNTNIPVYFVLAIMKTETQNFDEFSYNVNTNGSYDVGIMQINSSNISSFSKRYNLPDFENDPYDAELNTRAGIRYLAENWNVYYSYYQGDETKTLLATAGSYNRGVHNQNKYRNIYDYNSRVYAHWNNLKNGIDTNLNYSDTIPDIKKWLIQNYQL